MTQKQAEEFRQDLLEQQLIRRNNESSKQPGSAKEPGHIPAEAPESNQKGNQICSICNERIKKGS